MNDSALLAAAGLLAGFMNALAGGGSFVSLPALIVCGVPSVEANASSTLALLPGSIVSAAIYRNSVTAVGGVRIGWLLAITIAGGATGASLLVSTPPRAFDLVLPWLLLIATAALTFGRNLREAARRLQRVPPYVVLVLQFALGVYGGYFGGAVGIMMLAAWGLIDSTEVKTLNGLRTMLVSTANLVAALMFIAGGVIRWPPTALVCAGAILGGFLGARLSQNLPSHVVRFGTLMLTVCITAAAFLRLLFQHPAL